MFYDQDIAKAIKISSEGNTMGNCELELIMQV